MSNNNSKLSAKEDYFGGPKSWRYLSIIVAFMAGFMVLWNYMSPSRERNMVLNQGDILQHKGMSKEIADFRKTHNEEEPLWTNSMFGGMPSYQISTKYPNNLMQRLDNVLNLRGIVAAPAGNLLLLMFTMFILLLTLRVDPYSSGAAAFGFMMCSYFFSVIEAGHNSKVNAVAYLPLVFAGVLMLYRGRFWLGAAVTTLAMALEINANHLQITYYGFFVIGAIAISETYRGINALRKSPREAGGFMAYITGKGLSEGGKPVRNFIMGSLLLLVSLGIAFTPNIGRLQTNNEYVKETMRGGPVLKSTAKGDSQSAEGGGLNKEYAYVWSYGIAESFTIINPFYYGDAVNARLGKESETYEVLRQSFAPQVAEQLSNMWPVYIGDQPMHGGPTYMGIVICFLFILGLFIVPGRYRWWILGITILGIMLSWGRNLQWFSDIFYDHFPKYNNFRAVSMWLIIPSITMAIMAGLSLKEVFRYKAGGNDKRMTKLILAAMATTVGLLLVLIMVHPGADLSPASDPERISGFLQRVGLSAPDPQLLNALVDALEADRSDLISGPGYKSILITLLMGGVLIGYVRVRGLFESGLTRSLVIAGISLLFVAFVAWDTLPVNKRYLNEESFVKESEYMRPYTPSPADNIIKADKDPNYRVLNLAANIWNDAMTSYHHKSIGGYSAAKLRRYQDLIENCYDKEFQSLQAAMMTRDSTQSQKINDALKGVTVLNMMNTKYIIYNPDGGVLPNRYAMGNAWITGGAQVLAGPDEVIAKLQGTDLRKTMLVEEESAELVKGFQPAPDSAATIALTSYQPNELHYNFSSRNGKDQLVTFSEVYYNSGKGWQAYIDGQPAEHFRCNYILRGMRVPAGNHEIVFKMEPVSYYRGESLALVFSLLVFAVFVGGLAMDIRSAGKSVDDAASDEE